VRSIGTTGVAIVGEDAPDRCVQLTSQGGTVFLSRELPLESVRGCRLTVNCLVETKDVQRGPQLSSTAKVHLAVQTRGGIAHHSARLVGSAPWSGQTITADVPADATRAVLNLALEACSGRASFKQLIVANDRRAVRPLSLASTANAGHEQLGLDAFPKGTLRWSDEAIPFEIMDAASHGGRDCLRLKGTDHPDWPESTSSPIPVGTAASAIYILHAAPGGREKSESPCMFWTAQFADDTDVGFGVREGQQIGPVGRTEDLENWHVAFDRPGKEGGRVTFGVTKWTIHADSPIASISCEAYHGAAPVILAVTVVEEPPKPPADPIEYDEMGNPVEGNYE